MTRDYPDCYISMPMAVPLDGVLDDDEIDEVLLGDKSKVLVRRRIRLPSCKELFAPNGGAVNEN